MASRTEPERSISIARAKTSSAAGPASSFEGDRAADDDELDCRLTYPLPCDSVPREVADGPGDGLGEEIVDRGNQIEDAKLLVYVHDPLEHHERRAIRVAERERRGLGELQPLGA